MQKESEGIPEALEHFDRLPDSALVRKPTVRGLLGISEATLWRRCRDGELNPVRLSERVTAFRVGDLRAYLAAKAAA